MPVSCSTKVLGRDARRGPAAPIRVSDSGGSEGVGGGLYGVRTWGGGRGDLVNGSGWHLCVLCVVGGCTRGGVEGTEREGRRYWAWFWMLVR